MKIGIFSGTFDPIHVGHIAFCMEAIKACGLDKVFLVPEAEPRGKQNVTSLKHRLVMLELATQDLEGLEVLALKGKCFTVAETLPELRQLFPKDELTLLIGSDVVRTFAYRWPGIERLLSEMSLAIGLRHQDTESEIHDLMRSIQESFSVRIRYKCVSTTESWATSTSVRNGRIKDPNATDPRVVAYIAKHKIYEHNSD